MVGMLMGSVTGMGLPAVSRQESSTAYGMSSCWKYWI